jgi:ketosteroid isomerase-like protein
MPIRRVLTLLALPVILGAAPARIAAQQPSADSFDAERAVHNIFNAIARADTATLRALLGDDLHWIVASTGTVVNRSQLVAGAAAAVVPMATNEYTVDSVQSWRDGPVSIADYRLTNTRAFREYRQVFVSRATDVFTLRQGRWLLLRHTTTWIVHSPTLQPDIDSAQATAFVGHYDKGGGFVDDVHFQNGHLIAQSTIEKLTGAPGATLRRVSEDTFSPDGIAPMIVFERDATGRVVGYVQQAPDGSIARARRVVH